MVTTSQNRRIPNYDGSPKGRDFVFEEFARRAGQDALAKLSEAVGRMAGNIPMEPQAAAAGLASPEMDDSVPVSSRPAPQPAVSTLGMRQVRGPATPDFGEDFEGQDMDPAQAVEFHPSAINRMRQQTWLAGQRKMFGDEGLRQASQEMMERGRRRAVDIETALRRELGQERQAGPDEWTTKLYEINVSSGMNPAEAWASAVQSAQQMAKMFGDRAGALPAIAGGRQPPTTAGRSAPPIARAAIRLRTPAIAMAEREKVTQAAAAGSPLVQEMSEAGFLPDSLKDIDALHNALVQWQRQGGDIPTDEVNKLIQWASAKYGVPAGQISERFAELQTPWHRRYFRSAARNIGGSLETMGRGVEAIKRSVGG
jgi:hypothetical protein